MCKNFLQRLIRTGEETSRAIILPEPPRGGSEACRSLDWTLSSLVATETSSYAVRAISSVGRAADS